MCMLFNKFRFVLYVRVTVIELGNLNKMYNTSSYVEDIETIS